MTQTNTQEMAISLATKKEILFDINNGLFSEDYEPNSKYYHDDENDLDIEVLSEMNQLNGMWQFDVMIADSNGDEYILDEGQWLILNKALMQDIEWRNEEARSEAEHIKQLWRSAYA
jgi:hypothetical protein